MSLVLFTQKYRPYVDYYLVMDINLLNNRSLCAVGLISVHSRKLGIVLGV